MGFSKIIASFLISLLMVCKRSILLLFAPYQTMRDIRYHTSWYEVGLIAGAVYIYFQFAHVLRPYGYEPDILFLMTAFHIGTTILFFYLFTDLTHAHPGVSLRPFVMTYAYSLLPTVIWFAVTSSLYAVIPPPRSFTLWGASFSIVYIAFSFCMVSWKLILFYLAVRFSSQLAFYRIMYALLIYVAVLIPYMVMLYKMQYFRILFI